MDFKNLREQLTDEQIKEILAQYDVEPVFGMETDKAIVFPTCCHNLTGGKPKLYYYKNSKLFRCFTECASVFDIFTLLQKMHELRGKPITLAQAIELCGLSGTASQGGFLQLKDKNLRDYQIMIRDLNRRRQIQESLENEMAPLKVYNKDILRKFSFNYIGLMPWIEEGISIEALQQFNIKYDEQRNAIVIPNFDYDGNLIGIRERFFNATDVAKGKYRPLYDGTICYSHPTGQTFYGIYENHRNIEKRGLAIIFEGEKSLLKENVIYGKNNAVGLATLGQNLSRTHIDLLQKMKVRYVILAYDTDYDSYEELHEVEQRYIEKAKILAPYFNVSILLDYDFLLPYKSSPIDGGKEIFEKILKERRIVK